MEVVRLTMQATVLRVQRDSLLVFAHDRGQKVLVHTADACRFRMGNYVCIQYSGAMTMSIPPQISAESIEVIPRFGRRGSSCR